MAVHMSAEEIRERFLEPLRRIEQNISGVVTQLGAAGEEGLINVIDTQASQWLSLIEVWSQKELQTKLLKYVNNAETTRERRERAEAIAERKASKRKTPPPKRPKG